MIISVDTGGTKTIASAYDQNDNERSSVRFPTPKDTAQYVEQLLLTLEQILEGSQPSKIVIAIPGLIEENQIIWCKNLGWRDFDLASLVAQNYPGVPIKIINDANLAAYSETLALPTIPHKSLYVTVSTGIGTGLVTNGHLSTTLDNSEGGQIVLDYDGEQLMWEDFASGRAIYNQYGKLGEEIKDPTQWQDISDRISRGLLAIIPLLQPNVIIFGGSIGVFFDQYQAFLSEILEHKLPPFITRPELRQAVRPDHAVVYGGYLYAKKELR